jgi:hypothetical protein
LTVVASTTEIYQLFADRVMRSRLQGTTGDRQRDDSTPNAGESPYLLSFHNVTSAEVMVSHLNAAGAGGPRDSFMFSLRY